MSQSQCNHCGALLAPPTTHPWVCNYCGAMQQLPDVPEGHVMLADGPALEFLRPLLTGVDSTWLHPSIPPKKLGNVRQLHQAHLPADEEVLAIYDGTAFGSAKDGFIVTSRRICWKNQMEPVGFLEWPQVDEDEVYVDGNKLMLGNAKLETLLKKEGDEIYAWQDAVQTMARSARPPRQDDQQPEQEAGQQDAGWGGDEVSVGGGAQGAAWGGMGGQPANPGNVPMGAPQAHVDYPEERFPQRPYHDGGGCSVVDVHPAGGSVLAVGLRTVELRSAVDGSPQLTISPSDNVLCARFSQDGAWLITGGMDQRASLWEVATGQPRGATQEFEDYCDELVWLGAGTRFAAASQRGEVWIVDASTMQQTCRVLGPDPDYGQLGGMAATADGSRLFVSVGERLGAFDGGTGQIVWRADQALTNAARLAVSPNGDLLVAAGYDGVALFDARTGQAGAQFPFPCASNVIWPEGGGGLLSKAEDSYYSWSPRPRFSPTGDSIAVQDHVGNLAFIDPVSGALHPTGREAARAWIEDLAWFPDGNHVMLGMSDNSIAFWCVRPMACRLHTVAFP